MITMNNNDNKRAGFLDEIRGFAIICMVVYHIAFTLQEFYEINVPIFFDGWFYLIWAVFAGSFIFISGIVCRYSRNNIKRGAQCFLLGMMLTFITAIAAPSVAILFGILHFLGICMILFGLGEALLDRIPPLAGIAACVFMFSITWNISAEWIKISGEYVMKSGGTIGFGTLPWASFPLPEMLYEAKLLFPLGFYAGGFASGDYFPLFPWAFLFLAGAYFGVFVKRGSCPPFFYTTRIPFLAAAGRVTIWIYLLHQPIAMGILYFIYGH
ncbi:MAG: DUF1624 domain-containing protein [Oscillospiraceae bacterium]|nr:DUF1624 domain-containing protein [Oscillospiraceae bacterium]